MTSIKKEHQPPCKKICIDTQNDQETSEKRFASNFKKNILYSCMDNKNKEILDVMASEGGKKAIEHMFTDSDTGRKLSYSEMRSRYG
jgi:plasmid rolling circle replication initiator protein Rep